MSKHDKMIQGTGEPYQNYINPYQVEPDKTVVNEAGMLTKTEFGEYNPNVTIKPSESLVILNMLKMNYQENKKVEI